MCTQVPLTKDDYVNSADFNSVNVLLGVKKINYYSEVVTRKNLFNVFNQDLDFYNKIDYGR